MAGQQPVEDGRERPYVPAIHALLADAPQERRGCPRRWGPRRVSGGGSLRGDDRGEGFNLNARRSKNPPLYPPFCTKIESTNGGLDMTIPVKLASVVRCAGV